MVHRTPLRLLLRAPNILPLLPLPRNTLQQQSRKLSTTMPLQARVPPMEKISASSPSKGGPPRTRAKYQYRSPRYYRGRLAPNMPPPSASPSSRLYVPGPFVAERLEDHYWNTLAPDLQVLSYVHKQNPTFDIEKDYRQLTALRLPPKPTRQQLPALRTFRNIPRLKGITVHSMVRQAMKDSAHLHAAGMVVQSITGVRASVHKSKENIAMWELRSGKTISVTAQVKGRSAYRFLSQLIDVVLPRIKDWKGVAGGSGDSSGNITFGMSSEAVSMFPEIEVNYDMYPPKMVPGLHITIHTSAGNDVDAKILLKAMGLPFDGNFR
ncbi:ribosomal protein L5 domain-containing protein [Tuber borchii]|uniref:Large ribosomal subunit protein uL5m n=1 Tax=Tuber borchii TaxID=42251 RepID=A0A2T6ZD62_TUBBO|nr:ribosomal protein L5 domain-containing protein [Tuber borchii]